MSAEVEVLIAQHENVLMIPVAAVVETKAGNHCWVQTTQGAQRRMLELGGSNDVFTVVEKGLKEGDEVVLNPPETVAGYSVAGQSSRKTGHGVSGDNP